MVFCKLESNNGFHHFPHGDISYSNYVTTPKQQMEVTTPHMQATKLAALAAWVPHATPFEYQVIN